MNLKSISMYVGKALLVNALFMFLAVVVSVWNGLDEGFTPLLVSGVITLVVGLFPLIFVRDARANSNKDAFVIIFLSWTLSFLFGMLPYILYGGQFTVVNAWFESVSGYTTTGSTILTEVESLPKSILFWRSSTHYLGGLGIVVFLLLIMPDVAPFKHKLSNIEISSMSKDGYRYRSGKIARVMLTVYVGMTIAETLLLWAAGMSFYDAINHAFSTVATGGFSTRNNSIMYYDSVAIDLIIAVFMILASVHFGVIYAVFARRSLKPLRSDVPKYYLTLIACLTIFVTIVLLTSDTCSSFGKALRVSLFQVASFISTTGFGNADNAQWPMLACIVLLFAAIHCGCSGSTTGGLKADRMYIVLKEIGNVFQRRLHPSSLFRTKVDGAPVKDDTVRSVFQYVVVYLIVLFISFCLILVCGVDVTEAFSGTLSSLGNVGPALGSLGTMGNYAAQPLMAKIVYSIIMFMGRLEIYPVFIFFSLVFNRKKV